MADLDPVILDAVRGGLYPCKACGSKQGGSTGAWLQIIDLHFRPGLVKTLYTPGNIAGKWTFPQKKCIEWFRNV